MGKRGRLTLRCTSDDDDDDNDAPAPKPTTSNSSRPIKQQRRHIADGDRADLELVDGKDDRVLEEMRRNHEEKRRKETQSRRKPGRPVEEEEQSDGELEEKAEADDDEDGPGAVPLGEPVEVTGDGKHYAAFEYEGRTYKLEDSAMFSPDDEDRKPYVSIIRDINEIDGTLSVCAQWFYRPEDVEKESVDPRELFYSFHLDDVTAGSVMHMCVVHFIPQHKQVPSKKEHPGFIVQQVYDHIKEKFYKVTDKDYEDDKQQEIDLLVMKTMDRIGELPDCDRVDMPGEKSDNFPRRRPRKRHLEPKDFSTDAPTGRPKQLIKEDTTENDNLKNYAILFRYKAVTGNQSRDRWLDKFVDTILALPHSRNDNENSYASNEVVSIVASLEGSAFEAFNADFQKYNQKMRALLFNIKAGSTPAEIGSESEEPRKLQMTEARCISCSKKNVGVIDIIHANRGVHYKVECLSCGHTSWASGDDIV